jgi:outer membrane protein
MKRFLIIIFFLFNFNNVFSAENLTFYLESAYKNNPKLNAERENMKATKENINISRSEFLPSLSLSGSIDSKESTNRKNQSGTQLSDVSNKTETTSVSVEQKIFQGFEGYNSFKKSQLEVEHAKFKLKETEQSVIFDAAKAYFDLVYKTKSKKFNLSNIDLFERQFETDSARLQKGEITLTDLAQSESSLAGAKAKFISAETELLTTKKNFERIIRVKAPAEIEERLKLKVNLPKNLNNALNISKSNNPQLIMARLDYEITERNLNIEKAKFSPSASINYSKSENRDFSSSVDKMDQESVKASINWPLIKGGQNYSSIKKSKFKKNQSSLTLQDTVNSITTDTANAWSVYQSAESVLKATKAQVNAAEIANEGITLEYDSGSTRTILEVIQSRSLLLDARISSAKAERDYAISKFELLSILGELSLKNIKSS